MKKSILLLTLLLFSFHVSFGQEQTTLHSRTDERFEITSITARLAGYEEYGQCSVPNYAEDIDEYFTRYKTHPIVKLLQKERRNGISYNAISSAGYALDFSNGAFSLKPSYKKAAYVDARWSDKALEKYVKLLNEFYADTDFQRFYNDHSEIYDIAAKRMDEQFLTQIKTIWFEDFYGISFGSPEIYVSLTNGPSNYSVGSTDGNFGILVGCFADGEGNPAFSPMTFTTIIHELNHNFANPLASEYKNQMAAASEKIAPKIIERLRMGAYDSRAIGFEWLTRLGTLMYMNEHLPRWVPMSIGNDAAVGFIWQNLSFNLIKTEFSANRDKYPYFRDFMPRLTEWFNAMTDDFDGVMANFDNSCPRVVAVSPDAGSELDLSQDVVEIRFTFSTPMYTASRGFNWNGANKTALDEFMKDPKNSEGFEFHRWEDDRIFVVRMKSEWIKLGQIDTIVLPFFAMVSDTFQTMTENFTVTYSNFE